MAEIRTRRVRRAISRSLQVLSTTDRLIENMGRGVSSLLATRGLVDIGALPGSRPPVRKPEPLHADISESNEEFVVHVTIPGFEPGEIDVTAEPRELVIRAMQEPAGRPAGRANRARRDDEFRRIALPADVDVKQVSSKLKNGILTIVARKSRSAGRKVSVGAPP